MVKAANKTVKVKLIKSLNGRLEKHKATARGLGLTKMHKQVELEDTPSVRGMINKIAYLLQVGD